VITGGSSMMQGMVELGEEIFHMPVRVGVPHYNGALAEVVRHPRYSTAVGLLMAGMQQQRSRELAHMHIGPVRATVDRMKSWFTGNF
jgi:cell division protein FtsA